jgi:hypothetical protein
MLTAKRRKNVAPMPMMSSEEKRSRACRTAENRTAG